MNVICVYDKAGLVVNHGRSFIRAFGLLLIGHEAVASEMLTVKETMLQLKVVNVSACQGSFVSCPIVIFDISAVMPLPPGEL